MLTGTCLTQEEKQGRQCWLSKGTKVAPRYSVLFSRRHLGSLTQPALSALFLVSFVYCVRHLDIQCSSAVATLVPLLNQHCLPCFSSALCTVSGTSIFSALQPSPPWFPYSTSIVCLVSQSALCTVSGTSIFSALQPSPPWFPYSTSIVCLVSSQLCVLCQAPRYSVLFSRRHLGSLKQGRQCWLSKGTKVATAEEH